MNRATMKTKFKSHGSFRSQRTCDTKLKLLREKNPETIFEVITRTWDGKDKRRYMIRSVIRRGSKS